MSSSIGSTSTVTKRASFTRLAQSIRRRSGSLENGKPTKLFMLIGQRDFRAAESRLAWHPIEATVWTVIDSAAPDGTVKTLGSSCGQHHHEQKTGIRDSSASMSSSELSANDSCHRLALHLACALKPPASLIRALIHSHPDSIQCRERFGMLPLHIAVQNGASSEVVETLLEADETAAAAADSFGLLPIHLACTEGSSIAVVNALLRAHPESLEEMDRREKTPLDYAKDSLHPNKQDLIRELHRPIGYWSAPSVEVEPARVPELYYLMIQKEWDEAVARVSIHPQEANIWVLDPHSQWGSLPRLPLHVAVRRRAPLKVVEALLKANPGGARSRGGQHDLIPLHVACQNGAKADVVNTLLEFYPPGAKEMDEFGLLPLHLAITEGLAADVIELLLRAFPESARILDKSGNTALSYAKNSFHPNKNDLITLLRADPSIWAAPVPEDKTKLTVNDLIARLEWDLLYKRIRSHPEEVSEASPPKRNSTPRERRERLGWLPIHCAVAVPAPCAVIKALLASQPKSAQWMTADDEIPLHIACRSGASLETIELLLESYPIGTGCRDAKGRLPLHSACLVGASISVVDSLLQVDPSSATVRDGKSRTPILIVERSFHRNKSGLTSTLERATGSLIGFGTTTLYSLVGQRRWDDVSRRARSHPTEASVWSVDDAYGQGRLPLHLAVANKPPRTVVAALHNANPDAVRTPEKDGRYPLHVACKSGADLDVVQLLINTYPDAATSSDRHGLLPIHVACSEGSSIEVIKVLLRAAPGSFDAKDSRGWTALEYAELTHHDRGSILGLAKRSGSVSVSVPRSTGSYRAFRSNDVDNMVIVSKGSSATSSSGRIMNNKPTDFGYGRSHTHRRVSHIHPSKAVSVPNLLSGIGMRTLDEADSSAGGPAMMKTMHSSSASSLSRK